MLFNSSTLHFEQARREAIIKNREFMRQQLDNLRNNVLYSVADAKALVGVGGEECKLLERMTSHLKLMNMNDSAALAAIQFANTETSWKGDGETNDVTGRNTDTAAPKVKVVRNEHEFLLYKEIEHHKEVILAYIKELHRKQQTFQAQEALMSKIKEYNTIRDVINNVSVNDATRPGTRNGDGASKRRSLDTRPMRKSLDGFPAMPQR